MEITRQYIDDKRRVIQSQIDNLYGALEMLKVIEEDFIPKDALTLDDLTKMTGASSIDQPVEVTNGTA
jgi:hypothetical protein